MRRGHDPEATPRVDVRMDDDDAEPGGDEGRSGAARGRHPHGRRALAVLVVAVVAAVVAGTVVTNAAHRRADAARRAALAGVPGVLDPLEDPLRELWRAEQSSYALAYTDDVVAVATDEASLEVLDAATGEVRWRREQMPNESCAALARGGAGASLYGRLPLRAARAVCWTWSDIVQAEGPLVEPPTRLVVLDLATGAEVAALEVTGTVVGVEPLDDSALVASADKTGAVHVQRWSPTDGDVWAIDGEPGLLEHIQDGGLVFQARGPAFWLGGLDAQGRSVATGEPLADAGPVGDAFSSGAVALPDGGWATWTTQDRPGEARGGIWTRVADADGALRFEIAGRPWTDESGAAPSSRPMVTDDLPTDLLLMRLDARVGDSGTVAGIDARTGAVRWRGERLAGVSTCVRMGGVLVAAGAGRAYGFDVATGEELWRGAAAEPAGGVSVTDGERVVLPTTVGDGPALTSFDIGSGARRWDLVLAERPVALTALGHRFVLMVTESLAMVMLG